MDIVHHTYTSTHFRSHAGLNILGMRRIFLFHLRSQARPRSNKLLLLLSRPQKFRTGSRACCRAPRRGSSRRRSSSRPGRSRWPGCLSCCLARVAGRPHWAAGVGNLRWILRNATLNFGWKMTNYAERLLVLHHFIVIVCLPCLQNSFFPGCCWNAPYGGCCCCSG